MHSRPDSIETERVLVLENRQKLTGCSGEKHVEVRLIRQTAQHVRSLGIQRIHHLFVERGGPPIDHWRCPPDQEQNGTVCRRRNACLEVEHQTFFRAQFIRFRVDQYRDDLAADALVESDLFKQHA